MSSLGGCTCEFIGSSGCTIEIDVEDVVRLIAVSNTDTEIVSKKQDEWVVQIVQEKFIDVVRKLGWASFVRLPKYSIDLFDVTEEQVGFHISGPLINTDTVTTTDLLVEQLSETFGMIAIPI